MTEDRVETYKLIVEGMDCQDEVTIIEKKLISLVGIKDFQIYLATQGVKVVCDPSWLVQSCRLNQIFEPGLSF